MAPHVVSAEVRVGDFALDPFPMSLRPHLEHPDVVEDIAGSAAAAHHQQVVLVQVQLRLAVTRLGTRLSYVHLAPPRSLQIEAPNVGRARELSDRPLFLKAAIHDHLAFVYGGRVSSHGGRLQGFSSLSPLSTATCRQHLAPPVFDDVISVQFVKEPPPVKGIHGRMTPASE